MSGTRTGNGVAQAHAALRSLILTCEIEPGTRVSLAELSRRSGAGRTPLREALRMLEQEGLVTSSPNRGVTISPFDLDELDCLYAYRVSMEATAIRVSTPLMTPEDFDRLGEAMKRMDVAIDQRDTNSFQHAHRDFHGLLLAHTQQGVRARLALDDERSERFRRLLIQREEGTLVNAQREHEAIIDAQRRRDAIQASRLLASHLARSAFHVAGQLDPTYEPALTRMALRIVIGEN